MKPFIICTTLGLALAGCAGGASRYPSLAPRAVEKAGFDEPAAKAVQVVADPALDRRLVQLGSDLDGIARGFAADAARADRTAGAAHGQPVGSEAWLAAQSALAGLDDWRARASSLVTDVDALATERAAALQPEYPTLAMLRDRAQAEADRESATIARIQATLPAA